MTYFFKTMPSPVGQLTLVASEKGLAAVLWKNENLHSMQLSPLREADQNTVLVETERQLTEYFAGTRKVFELPLDPVGTPFQRSVWDLLLKIPFGETRTYGELARTLGQPGASRAVGLANGRNPIPIIAACHRVIGSNGKLTGFAGGLECKEWLLRHEGARLL
jgi:methylated-DNA-[protein]-cysteine S-methyltransferase